MTCTFQRVRHRLIGLHLFAGTDKIRRVITHAVNVAWFESTVLVKLPAQRERQTMTTALLDRCFDLRRVFRAPSELRSAIQLLVDGPAKRITRA